METASKHDEDTIPDHIPAELFRPIGLAEGPEFLADPHGYMADLLETQPRIFFSPGHVDSWHVTHYDDVIHVLRHSEVFSSRGCVSFPRDPENYFDFIPLEIDPPLHRKYRAILDPMFSPKGVACLEQDIRKLANELIDQFIGHRHCEFARDFARPLPVSVFLNLMGLPLDKRDTFVGWAVDLLHSGDLEIAGNAMLEIAEYLSGVIAEHEQSPPGDDIVSRIVHAEVDGQQLTDQEKFGFAFFLFIGGLDTVFAVLNNSFRYLADHPESRQQINSTPDILPAAVEELLRSFGVTFSGRLVAKDIEMHGVKMKAGDRVTCVLPAANFDPEVFENPRRVDFDRPRKPHLTFAGGPHSCMGAHLARLELRVAIGEFLRRIPDFQIVEGAEIKYLPGGVVGPDHLPLMWS